MNELKITALENGEELLNEARVNGKVALVRRVNGIIDEIEIFDTTEDFISDYVVKQILHGYEYDVFTTGEKAYILACNSEYAEYLETLPITYDEEQAHPETVHLIEADRFRNLLSYDEVAKKVNREQYKDGLYDYTDLRLAIVDGENSTHTAKGVHFMTEGCDKDDYETWPKVDITTEFYSKKSNLLN